MAKPTSNIATPASEPVIVAGHKLITFEDGNTAVVVLCKNAISKNPLFKAKSTKTGSVRIADGITLDEIKTLLPLGTLLQEASWGAKRETEFEGVYEVEGL